MTRVARERWAKLVARWKESGLSAAEFAAEANINARSLAWWRWHLASEQTTAKRGSRSSARARSTEMTTTISPLTFIEMGATETIEGLEVVLRSSVRIKVRPGFDSATLVRLLDVLEQRR